MRKNTGMAYKRRQRSARIRREKAAMMAAEKQQYQWNHDVGRSFEEYAATDPYMRESVHKAGFFSKRSFRGGWSSTVYRAWGCWSFYPRKDVREAVRALSAYDEYGVPDAAANKSEALRKAHDADRKSAKHRKTR